MMRIFTTLIIFIILSIQNTFAQDTLILMNGDSLLVGDFNKKSNGKYTFDVITQKGKIKSMTFFPAELYALKKNDGKEIIFFEGIKENFSGMDLSTENVKFYIQGEAYAKKHYKFIVGKVVNFIAGAAAPFVSTYIAGSIIFAPLLPLAVSTAIGYAGPSAKTFDRRFAANKFNRYFKEGYLVAGRVIRINKGIKYGFAGFITGLSGYIIAVKFL